MPFNKSKRVTYAIHSWNFDLDSSELPAKHTKTKNVSTDVGGSNDLNEKISYDSQNINNYMQIFAIT